MKELILGSIQNLELCMFFKTEYSYQLTYALSKYTEKQKTEFWKDTFLKRQGSIFLDIFYYDILSFWYEKYLSYVQLVLKETSMLSRESLNGREHYVHVVQAAELRMAFDAYINSFRC